MAIKIDGISEIQAEYLLDVVMDITTALKEKGEIEAVKMLKKELDDNTELVKNMVLGK